MVFIRKKTNRYVTKAGKAREYTYGLLVRSQRLVSGESPTQQVIKYLGRDYDEQEIMGNLQLYVEEFEDLGKKVVDFAKKHKDLSAKEFYISFVEDYLRKNGFKRKGENMVLRDVVIHPKTFSVKKKGKTTSVQIGLDLCNKEFLRDIYTQLKSIRG